MAKCLRYYYYVFPLYQHNTACICVASERTKIIVKRCGDQTVFYFHVLRHYPPSKKKKRHMKEDGLRLNSQRHRSDNSRAPPRRAGSAA